MGITTIPQFQPPVTALYRLTDSDFQPAAFKTACESFAHFDSEMSDHDLWQFQLHQECSLLVALWSDRSGANKRSECQPGQASRVSCAVLSFCWWETWEKTEHKTLRSYNDERALYDGEFLAELERARKALGEPHILGRDKDENAHRFALWRGKNGLLVLQQSANDLQFGCDINYWIQNWTGGDPKPTSPFIDWLHRQSLLPPGIVLPETWELCGPGFEQELAKETSFNLLHSLRGVKATSIARRKGRDDVLFQLFHHSHELAEVHLTWVQEFRPDWPAFTLYESWSDWLAEQ